jgi:hypothetical protein
MRSRRQGENKGYEGSARHEDCFRQLRKQVRPSFRDLGCRKSECVRFAAVFA